MTSRNVAIAVLLLCIGFMVPSLALADATENFIAAQKAAARQLTQEGRLAEALAMWQTLLPLGTGDEEIWAAIADLESDIASRVTTLLRSARRAYANGRSEDGDRYMLKVLALQPGQRDALLRLRRSHSTFAQRQQQQKSEIEYQARVGNPGVPVKAPSPPPQDLVAQLKVLERKGDYAGMVALAETSSDAGQADAAALLRDAHVALAEQAEGDKKLDDALAHVESAMTLQPVENDPLLDRSAKLRGKLSTSWYEKGVRLIQTDLPAAIDALSKALNFNPYNVNAKRKLAQAETLQRNLSRIEGAR